MKTKQCQKCLCEREFDYETERKLCFKRSRTQINKSNFSRKPDFKSVFHVIYKCVGFALILCATPFYASACDWIGGWVVWLVAGQGQLYITPQPTFALFHLNIRAFKYSISNQMHIKFDWCNLKCNDIENWNIFHNRCT